MTVNANMKSGILRTGAIKSTKQLRLLRRWPDLEGNRPILVAELGDGMLLPRPRTQTHITAQVISGSEQQIFLFRLQVGATLICWLVDPYAPEIHAVLNEWARAGNMFVALSTAEGVRILTRPVVGKLAATNSALSSSDEQTSARFHRTAQDAVASGLIKAQAHSEISSVKTIRKLQIFSASGWVVAS